jgi:hypothetical protein
MIALQAILLSKHVHEVFGFLHVIPAGPPMPSAARVSLASRLIANVGELANFAAFWALVDSNEGLPLRMRDLDLKDFALAQH